MEIEEKKEGIFVFEFNENHPEKKREEIFLGNYNEKRYFQIDDDTKRRGIISYNSFGEVLNDCFPVFVKKREKERFY